MIWIDEAPGEAPRGWAPPAKQPGLTAEIIEQTQERVIVVADHTKAGTIADFTINRELDFDSNPPLANTRPLYAIYFLGNVPFAGAGDYDNATRDRLRTFNAWYGYPAADAHLTKRVTTLSQMGALAGYRGDATTMRIRVGCFRRTTSCSGPAGGRVYHVLYGIDITVSDPQPPAPTVAAEGLLAGGPRSGSDPVVVSATDWQLSVWHNLPPF